MALCGFQSKIQTPVKAQSILQFGPCLPVLPPVTLPSGSAYSSLKLGNINSGNNNSYPISSTHNRPDTVLSALFLYYLIFTTGATVVGTIFSVLQQRKL